MLLSGFIIRVLFWGKGDQTFGFNRGYKGHAGNHVGYKGHAGNPRHKITN